MKVKDLISLLITVPSDLPVCAKTLSYKKAWDLEAVYDSGGICIRQITIPEHKGCCGDLSADWSEGGEMSNLHEDCPFSCKKAKECPRCVYEGLDKG